MEYISSSLEKKPSITKMPCPKNVKDCGNYGLCATCWADEHKQALFCDLIRDKVAYVDPRTAEVVVTKINKDKTNVL